MAANPIDEARIKLDEVPLAHAQRVVEIMTSAPAAMLNRCGTCAAFMDGRCTEREVFTDAGQLACELYERE